MTLLHVQLSHGFGEKSVAQLWVDVPSTALEQHFLPIMAAVDWSRCRLFPFRFLVLRWLRGLGQRLAEDAEQGRRPLHRLRLGGLNFELGWFGRRGGRRRCRGRVEERLDVELWRDFARRA